MLLPLATKLKYKNYPNHSFFLLALVPIKEKNLAYL